GTGESGRRPRRGSLDAAVQLRQGLRAAVSRRVRLAADDRPGDRETEAKVRPLSFGSSPFMGRCLFPTQWGSTAACGGDGAAPEGLGRSGWQDDVLHRAPAV